MLFVLAKSPCSLGARTLQYFHWRLSLKWTRQNWVFETISNAWIGFGGFSWFQLVISFQILEKSPWLLFGGKVIEGQLLYFAMLERRLPIECAACRGASHWQTSACKHWRMKAGTPCGIRFSSQFQLRCLCFLIDRSCVGSIGKIQTATCFLSTCCCLTTVFWRLIEPQTNWFCTTNTL